jgi:hypothetical protein
VSWNPAVPPPPAAGAPLGILLAEELGDDAEAVGGVVKTVEGLADGVAVTVAVRVMPGVEVVPPLGLVLGATPLEVPLGELVAPIEPDTVTEGMVGAVVDVPPVHAVIAAEPRIVSAPAPISLALSANPAMVVCSFIEPPRPPYAIVRFPVLASQTRVTKVKRDRYSRC